MKNLLCGYYDAVNGCKSPVIFKSCDECESLRCNIKHNAGKAIMYVIAKKWKETKVFLAKIKKYIPWSLCSLSINFLWVRLHVNLLSSGYADMGFCYFRFTFDVHKWTIINIDIRESEEHRRIRNWH